MPLRHSRHPRIHGPCDIHDIHGIHGFTAPITWIDPVKHANNRMTGRSIGDEIVQEYHADDGKRVQWLFTDITPDAFHSAPRRLMDYQYNLEPTPQKRVRITKTRRSRRRTKTGHWANWALGTGS
jgi:hypothetical protein